MREVLRHGVPWLGLVVGLVVAAWGGGTVRSAAVQRDDARYRRGWVYLALELSVLVMSYAGLTTTP